MSENLSRLFAVMAVIATTSCASIDPALSNKGTTLYENAQVWTGGGFTEKSFAIRDGVFIDPDRVVPEQVTRVDMSGRWVMPPFGDAHTHKFEGTWSFESFNNQFMQQGVFYAQNPAGLPRLMRESRELAASPETVDVTYAMGGITTPYGHPEEGFVRFMTHYAYRGETRESLRGTAVHAVKNEQDVREAIETLVADEADFVKVFLEYSEEYDHRSRLLEDDDYRATADYPDYDTTSGVDPALVPLIVQIAHENGLEVRAHVTTINDFRTAIDAGVDHLLHMPGRSAVGGDTGVKDIITKEDAARAARAGVTVTPTAAVRLAAIADEDREWVYELQKQNIRRLIDAGVPVLIGIDNYGETTRTEIDHLRDIGALTDLEILQAWTQTPVYIFPERSLGAIEPGFEGSFLILDANPLEDFTTLDRISGRVKQGLEITLSAPEAR